MSKIKPGPKSRHEGMFPPGQSGNVKGRPKGAKGRSNLPRPERVLLNSEDSAIQQLVAIAKNDTEKMNGRTEIPIHIQLQAIKHVLELVKEIKAKYEISSEDEEESSNVTSLFSTKA